MKRLSLMVLSVMAAISLVQRASAEVDFIVDVLPASIHANLAADDFWVSSPQWGQEKPSVFSVMPNVAIGADIATTAGYLDLKAGTGLLLNSSLYSYMFYGTVGWYQEIKPSIFFGPHAGITYFPAPDWWGNTEIEFTDTTGFVLGLHFSAGDKISYLVSVDYFSMAFDVDMATLPANTTVSDKSLDMSGIAAQFGLRIQF